MTLPFIKHLKACRFGRRKSRLKPNVLTVVYVGPNQFTLTFDRAVAVLSTPTGGQFQINDEDPSDATSASPTEVTVTMPTADGTGYGWSMNDGSWLSPVAFFPATGTVS